MAVDYIDGSLEGDKNAASTGTGGTVTGLVRILYDDTKDPNDVYTEITRLRDRLRENLAAV